MGFGTFYTEATGVESTFIGTLNIQRHPLCSTVVYPTRLNLARKCTNKVVSGHPYVLPKVSNAIDSSSSKPTTSVCLQDEHQIDHCFGLLLIDYEYCFQHFSKLWSVVPLNSLKSPLQSNLLDDLHLRMEGVDFVCVRGLQGAASTARGTRRAFSATRRRRSVVRCDPTGSQLLGRQVATVGVFVKRTLLHLLPRRKPHDRFAEQQAGRQVARFTW